MPAPTNVHKRFRQDRKAYALSRAIWSLATTEQRTDRTWPARVVAQMTQGERDQWARFAATTAPSQESWDLVVEKLRDRVEDELRWLSLDEPDHATPYDGCGCGDGFCLGCRERRAS